MSPSMKWLGNEIALSSNTFLLLIISFNTGQNFWIKRARNVDMFPVVFTSPILKEKGKRETGKNEKKKEKRCVVMWMQPSEKVSH